jgi:hypothetical protein
LQPDPSTSKPVKTTSGMLCRLKNSVLMGKSSILDFGSACLSHWTKERCDRLARGARKMHPIIAAGTRWLGKNLDQQQHFTIAGRE